MGGNGCQAAFARPVELLGSGVPWLAVRRSGRTAKRSIQLGGHVSIGPRGLKRRSGRWFGDRTVKKHQQLLAHRPFVFQRFLVLADFVEPHETSGQIEVRNPSLAADFQLRN